MSARPLQTKLVNLSFTHRFRNRSFSMFGHKLLSAALGFLILSGLPFFAGCANNAGNRGCLDGTNCGDTSTVVTTGSSSTFSNTNNIQPTTTSNRGTLQCSVDVPSVVTAGQSVSLTIRASGGSVVSGQSLAQYYLPSISGYSDFTATTGAYAQMTASGSYNNANTNGTNIVASRTFAVADRAGNTGTCSFSITVQPSNYSGTIPTGNSACLLSTSTPNPAVNQAFTLNLSAAAYPALVQQISFQSNWNIAFNASLNAAQNFNVTYTSAGPRTITALVQSNGNVYTCSTAITVVNTAGAAVPTLQIVVQPGTTVNVGSIITLHGVTAGFLNTPNYGFVSNESGVQLIANGNSVAVTAIDGRPHNFTVTATAISSTESASAQIPLTFQGGSISGAYCLLQAPTGSLAANASVGVTVVAIDGYGNVLSGQPVDIIDVAVNGGSVGSGTCNPISAIFPSAGTYLLNVHAKLHNSGIVCNGGGVMQEAITIH